MKKKIMKIIILLIVIGILIANLYVVKGADIWANVIADIPIPNTPVTPTNPTDFLPYIPTPDLPNTNPSDSLLNIISDMPIQDTQDTQDTQQQPLLPQTPNDFQDYLDHVQQPEWQQEYLNQIPDALRYDSSSTENDGTLSHEEWLELMEESAQAIIEERQEEEETGIINPNNYRPSIGADEAGEATVMGQKIVGVINVIGTIILIVSIIVLGIKYMLGSIEERSEYKKTMWPILIGAILLFGVSWILKILYEIVPNGI